MSRASASPSPSVYVRSVMDLRPIASATESNGWGRTGSGPLLDLLALLFGSLGLACLLRLPFYGPRRPAAPLGVAPLVEDAAAQRRVGGEARRLGPEEVVCPLPLHPVPYLLVPGELLLVATSLLRQEPCGPPLPPPPPPSPLPPLPGRAAPRGDAPHPKRPLPPPPRPPATQSTPSGS